MWFCKFETNIHTHTKNKPVTNMEELSWKFDNVKSSKNIFFHIISAVCVEMQKKILEMCFKLEKHSSRTCCPIAHFVQLCNLMDCSMPGFPVHHHLPELAQFHVHWVGDAIQPSHSLPSPSPPVFSHSQCQGLFQRVSSLHQMLKVLELQSQHQSFQWTLRTDFH